MLSIFVLGFLSLSKKLCPTITVNSVTPSGTSPRTLFTSVLVPYYKCLGDRGRAIHIDGVHTQQM